jgi:predicted tellurium resistance membrane protein TerC
MNDTVLAVLAVVAVCFLFFVAAMFAIVRLRAEARRTEGQESPEPAARERS